MPAAGVGRHTSTGYFGTLPRSSAVGSPLASCRTGRAADWCASKLALPHGRYVYPSSEGVYAQDARYSAG